MKGVVRDPYEIIAGPARRVKADIEEWRIREAVQTRLEKFAAAVTNIETETQRTLAELRRAGKRLALVSNVDASEMSAWPESPIREAFDAVVLSCEVGMAKPEPGIYLEACKRLGLRPSECMFVGDGGSQELSGARALGITTVQMTGIISQLWPEAVEELGRGADYRIERISALVNKG